MQLTSESLPTWFLEDVKEAIREAKAGGRRREAFRTCPRCGRSSLRLRATRFSFTWGDDEALCDVLPDGTEVNARCLKCGWQWTREELDW